MYDDLIRSGLLKRRGGAQTENDTWLEAIPEWRRGQNSIEEDDMFGASAFSATMHSEGRTFKRKTVSLWFYFPLVNGNMPAGPHAWKRYDEEDRCKLEEHHVSRKWRRPPTKDRHGPNLEPSSPERERNPRIDVNKDLSQWYDPDPDRDVLIDEDRQCVSWHASGMVMRPVFWRHYGLGDSVRRAVWTQDSGKNMGLQPYCEQSAQVLEDAWQFLKWHMNQKGGSQTPSDDHKSNSPVLLTVQVVAPDGSDQLVQFRSLRQILAVKKTLGGALSLFKKRVYRGADVIVEDSAGRPERESDLAPGLGVVEDFSMPDFSASPAPDTSAATLDDELAKSLSAPLQFSAQYRAFPDSPEDSVEHLVLIVHGIGKALQSFELLGLVQVR